MGQLQKTLLSKTTRTGDVNGYSTRINTQDATSISIFLDANTPVIGRVVVTVVTTDDSISTLQASVGSFSLGSFTTVSGGSRRNIINLSPHNNTGYGTCIWIRAAGFGSGETVNQGTTTFGVGAILHTS